MSHCWCGLPTFATMEPSLCSWALNMLLTVNFFASLAHGSYATGTAPYIRNKSICHCILNSTAGLTNASIYANGTTSRPSHSNLLHSTINSNNGCLPSCIAMLNEPVVLYWVPIHYSTPSQSYIRANATAGTFDATVTETMTLIFNLTAGTSSLVSQVACGASTNSNLNQYGTATTEFLLGPGTTTTMYETFVVIDRWLLTSNPSLAPILLD